MRVFSVHGGVKEPGSPPTWNPGFQCPARRDASFSRWIRGCARISAHAMTAPHVRGRSAATEEVMLLLGSSTAAVRPVAPGTRARRSRGSSRLPAQSAGCRSLGDCARHENEERILERLSAESIVFGVTMLAGCSSILRPRILPLTASRRRWSSLSSIRFFPSFSRRIRFSARRYSTASCCLRLIHPARISTSRCHG